MFAHIKLQIQSRLCVVTIETCGRSLKWPVIEFISIQQEWFPKQQLSQEWPSSFYK